MCTENNIGKLTTFYEMVDHTNKESVDKILIPQIQRDYAQGRPSQEKLRGRFLKRLFSAIDSSTSEKCEIDYIYGKRISDKKEEIFLPLDGQQRLTTLFLLHLYIAKRAGIEADEIHDLRKFSYETRDSSTQFCKNLNDIPAENFRGIKEYIENQWWYNRRWKNDPTISSMIVMLQDIDHHYEGTEWNFCEIWERLKGNITFWLLYLDDLQATDDLYIKMNSRGKLLTDFEHFKAQIVSYIPKDDVYKNFSRKIDTDWTDLLWAYRDTSNDGDPEKYMDNGLDKMFLNIFTLYMFLEGVKRKIIEYSPLDQRTKFETLDPLDLVEKVVRTNPELFLRFECIMDFFHQKENVKAFFESIFTNTAYEENTNEPQDKDDYRVYIPKNELGDSDVDYLRAVAKGEGLSARKVLMIEAFFELASQSKNNNGVVDIKEKIRIIRNLSFNSDTRAERMLTLLVRVDTIMSDLHAIDTRERGGFDIAQSKQEINKLKWIIDNPGDEMTIKNVENHSLIIGNLSIYMKGYTCLINEMKRHKELFHKDANYDLIERLLLTIGDYSYKYNERRQYGGKNNDLWRENIFVHTNEKMTSVLIKLFQDTRLPNLRDDETITKYIDEWLKEEEGKRNFTWEYYLVKYDGMRHGDEGRYLIKNGNYGHIMLNKNQLNGKHWYPFLYCINELLEYKYILNDYGDSLRLPNYKVDSHEHRYTLTPNSGGEVIPIAIPHNENGIDKEDRILLAKKEIEKLISQA